MSNSSRPVGRSSGRRPSHQSDRPSARSSRRGGFYPDYAEDFVDRGVEPTKSEVSIYESWFDAANAKAAKGTALGYLNAIHYMAPANQAGAGNVCPWAARCVKPCLTSSGKGGADSVIKGRIRRARLWWEDHRKYCELHRKTIGGMKNENAKMTKSLIQVAKRVGLHAVLRLNGTSDIAYEEDEFGFGLLQDMPGLFKYDYTKGWPRVMKWLEGDLNVIAGPKGRRVYFRERGAGAFKDVYRYHLTLSLGGTLDREPDADRIYQHVLNNGGTVAAVWVDEETAMSKINGDGIDSFTITNQDGKVVRTIDLGKKRRVIDGNYLNGDIRFLDEPGVIVGLYAKGQTILKDAGRGFKTPCPQCGNLVVWSGVHGQHRVTCLPCTKRMWASGELKKGKYFEFEPTIKGEMAHHGDQFFLNPSSRRALSGSASRTGFVTEGLPMGSMRHEGKIIHIDCPM